jgi:hypothetical protein
MIADLARERQGFTAEQSNQTAGLYIHYIFLLLLLKALSLNGSLKF